MWLLVVAAAGSGYLARCLQNSSSAKRPRLVDQASDSRSPPQDCSGSYIWSEETLQAKDRFESLEEEQKSDQSLGEEKRWKKSCCGSSSDAMEGSLVPLTSFQKGIHDLGSSPSKLKCKTGDWPSSWPKNKNRVRPGQSKDPLRRFPEKDNQLDVQEFSNGGSDDDLVTFQEKHEISCRMEEAGEGNSVQLVPNGEANITIKTPLGDVSWTASRRDAERLSLESLGDLPNILDWTSMAASQKHSLFGLEADELSTPKCRRSFEGKKKSKGARSRSRDSSATSTVAATPLLPALPSVVRKRKAAHDSGFLAKEVLFYAMGMHVGVSSMLLYHRSEMEKVNRLGKQQSALNAITADSKLQRDDDNDSVTSVVTVEAKPLDQMAVLEAELEAELEIMEMNLTAHNDRGCDNFLSSNVMSSIVSLHDESGGKHEDSSLETTNWAISPRDLDRRLHIVLEERQAKQIQELETQLQEAERKLHSKEEELRSWKDRVYRISETSLTSPTNDTAPAEAISCDTIQRPVSRKKWFSEDSEECASQTSQISGISSCRGCEKDELDYSGLAVAVDRLSLNSRESCVTVSELNRNGERLNGSANEAVRMGRRSSLGTGIPSIDGRRQSDGQIREEHLMYNQLDRTKSKFVRTVETKCTIEERHIHESRFQDIQDGDDKWISKKLSRPRHSTGNLFAARHRCQKQRRRWFS